MKHLAKRMTLNAQLTVSRKFYLLRRHTNISSDEMVIHFALEIINKKNISRCLLE
jgi:hypothetical protein